MAPVAAAFSTGIPGEKFGPEVDDYEKIEMTQPIIKDNEIFGQVLYTDKFGNLITNIPEGQIHKLRERYKDNKLMLHVQGVEISRYEESYSRVEKGELLFLIGSLGFLEIACREDSAARKIKAKSGDIVKVRGQTLKT
jgi:S-adenosylmethionine hydrolase